MKKILAKIKLFLEQSIASFKKFINTLLFRTGDFLPLIEDLFQNRRSVFYAMVAIVSTVLWLFVSLIINMVGEKKNLPQSEFNNSYSAEQKAPVLSPLADYYFFENKIDVEEDTDLIVQPNLGIEMQTMKDSLRQDLGKARIFLKDEKIIQQEMSKLNQ